MSPKRSSFGGFSALHDEKFAQNPSASTHGRHTLKNGCRNYLLIKIEKIEWIKRYMTNVAFHTLGCKVNQYDTQTMMQLFENAPSNYHIVPFDEFADIYIINTCTVTAMSDRKSRQMISRAVSQNPRAVVVVAGCFAQTDADSALLLPGVSLVIGNKNRSKIVSLVEQVQTDQIKINAVEKILATDDFEDLPAMTDGHTRAHIKIQEGCNRFCTYCIIPYARGNIRSRSLEGIARETLRLTSQGFKEFVLTGIHLASYKTDDGQTLADVIDMVCAIPGVERLRLSSLEPTILSENFLSILKKHESKICEQIHLSLQSGCDTVLQRMNRQYTTAQYAQSVSLLRSYFPKIAVTTDIIAGFPGETEQEHRQTLDFIKQINFARLHVFPFSKRDGTVAAKMPNQLSNALKSARAKEIISLGKALEHDYIQKNIGSSQKLLFETYHDGVLAGYTTNYIHVHVPCPDPMKASSLLNTIQPVKIIAETSKDQDYAVAMLI